MVLGKVREMPDFGSAQRKIGVMMLSHCFLVRLIASMGYSMVFMMVVFSACQDSEWESVLDRIWSANAVAFSFICRICSLLLPSMERKTPRVSRASEGSTLSRCSRSPETPRTDSSPGLSVEDAYCHSLFFHTKSMRYQKLLSTLSAPPVVRSPPSQ